MTMTADNSVLAEWNGRSPEAAAEAILPCNGSSVWATLMASHRPFDSPEAVFAMADTVWASLPESDWHEAFDSHPRIGEKKAKAATAKSLDWSGGEQAAAKLDEQTQAELAEANREYEAKFGRIFLVCATGKSATEMLGILRRRLKNDAKTELQEAAEQQRQITQLRLRKWLQIPLETK
jgi:2-oxo-4-hydroxy-4-carboxy-5-ureidoimidazoline decarboxylase